MGGSSQVTNAQSHYGWAFKVIGTIASACAIISLLQRWNQIELATIPAQLLAYYRGMVNPAIDAVFALVGWKPFPGYADVLAINAVVVGCAVRALHAVRYKYTYAVAVGLGLLSLIMFGWSIALVVIMAVSLHGKSESDAAITEATFENIGKALAAFGRGDTKTLVEFNKENADGSYRQRVETMARVSAPHAFQLSTVWREFLTILGWSVLAAIGYFLVNATIR